MREAMFAEYDSSQSANLLQVSCAACYLGDVSLEEMNQFCSTENQDVTEAFAHWTPILFFSTDLRNVCTNNATIIVWKMSNVKTAETTCQKIRHCINMFRRFMNTSRQQTGVDVFGVCCLLSEFPTLTQELSLHTIKQMHSNNVCGVKRLLLLTLLRCCWNKDKTLHADQRGFVLSDVMQIHFLLVSFI